jgi:hypothetical protein
MEGSVNGRSCRNVDRTPFPLKAQVNSPGGAGYVWETLNEGRDAVVTTLPETIGMAHPC